MPSTRSSVSASRATTAVPSSSRMIGRWIARGWAHQPGHPVVAVRGVARQVAEPGVRALLLTRDLPRLGAEPPEDVAQLRGRRGLVEAGARLVALAGPLQSLERGSGLAARHGDPDLHARHPRISRVADHELLEIADELYALRSGDFTPARDARAKELKGTDLAAPVKALKKPSLAAWVVNLLVRRDADQVDQVLSLGAALREAAAGMDGDELRNLTKQRRQLTAAVTTGARALAASGGVKVTQAVADQVEATLTAAMVDPRCATRSAAGCW